MNPSLVAIAGPLKGALLALADEEVSIGREESNRLWVDDPSASRRHCVIRREADKFKLSDLNSRNGTFVNDLPVKERLLEHGDEIKIGTSVFLFLLSLGQPAAAQTAVQFDHRVLDTRSTLHLRREDALYLQPDKVREALPPSSRIARDLNALLRIATAIQSTQGLEVLERQLLELAFEVAPAQHGAILVIGESTEELVSVLTRDRHSGSNRPVQVNRTIVDRVLREGVAVLSNDVSENAAGGSGPPVSSPIHSLLAAPLMYFNTARGVIYLDTSDPNVRFEEDLLQLFTAIGAIAGMALENVRRREWLERENRRLQEEINIQHDMVGESPKMREVFQFIARVARTDSTVLISGESGTGKELVACAIHRNSPRATKPFVAINCAALSEPLLESELFGHERGAFTGAIAQKKGKFEVANGGTVFLDEVAELAPALQAKLLRVLQEREFERVGGTRPLPVDLRFIAATNKNPAEAAKGGSLREDLYFRLNVVSLTMPPLRERREDIRLLATYFAVKCSAKAKRPVMGISAEAQTCLVQYDWPGNVRELQNAIERAVVLGSADVILPEDLPEVVAEAGSPTTGAVTRYHEAVKAARREIVQNAMEQAGGKVMEAARLLGVHPNNLHRLLRDLDIKKVNSKE